MRNYYDGYGKCKKYNIPLRDTSWIIGLPKETKESLNENVSAISYLLDKEYITYAGPRFLVPLPGTPIYNAPQEYGISILTHNIERYMPRSYPPLCKPAGLSMEDMLDAFINCTVNKISVYADKLKIEVLGD